MEVLRYTAFCDGPSGGNPAGVVLDAAGASSEEMQKTAREVGYSETAFLQSVGDAIQVRYFSPKVEVPFCGHATIAAAVAFAERFGTGDMLLRTQAGYVTVATSRTSDNAVSATLTSVVPQTAALPLEALDSLLHAFGWTGAALDPAFPVKAAYAGAWHPVIAVDTRERLAALHYDMDALATLMAAYDWATVNVIWRARPQVFFARNPFPPGGVYEDPATGAAAAALGGYLRELDLVSTPARVEVFQGQDMGRPSRIVIDIPADPASGIRVTGTARPVQSPVDQGPRGA
ncbi:PhzF family phenazine biosynthesis protein [Glycomyces sp. MUSA5-2]|uniref:PhzF family phenazine biosynthesis protein n=1 Tax=Glycomyces sp. MUSA5-2 TaxID=2053002 RepID=UPI003FA57FD4